MRAAPPGRSTGMRRALLLSVLLWPAFAADARACSCVGTAAVLVDAERVFVGTVAERRTTDTRNGYEVQAVYAFDVERVVRGEVPERIELRAATEEASCGVDLPVGRRVAVMLTQPGGDVSLCQIVDPAQFAPAPPPAQVDPAVTALLGQAVSACAQIARWTFSAR